MTSFSSVTAEDIATCLGLKRYTRSWRGRCPACDYDTTFIVRAGRDGRPLLFCASCQDYDAIAQAVALASGQDYRGSRGVDPDEAARRQYKQQRALALWLVRSRFSDPGRNIFGTPWAQLLTTSPVLRFRPDARHPEGGRYPALIALIQDVDGIPIAVHRTFLTRDGRKANVEPVKASLGPNWGGAIRLQAAEAEKPLVIGEGLETSASAGRLMGLPAWAAISAGNLSKGLVLPSDVRLVTIAGDPDEPGLRAAREAWARWSAEGRTVRITVPNGTGDFNDLLMAREADHA